MVILGKSQIKKLAEHLVGYENVSSIDLGKLCERFGASAIYQKRLSGCNDMSYQSIKDMSIFKHITCGDSIYIEYKNKNAFDFTYKGFLWLNCNKLPLFGGDTGKWVYDRIMTIYCNNVIPKEKQNPKLFDEMLKEKNTIIKKALIQLKRLINNNYKFIEPECMAENRKRYETENNTLLTFITECCTIWEKDVVPRIRIPRSIFKQAYSNWVKFNNNNRGKLNNKEFNDTLNRNYGEAFVKSDGTWYMRSLTIDREFWEELRIGRDTSGRFFCTNI